MVSLLRNLYRKINASRPNLNILSYGCYGPEYIFKTIVSEKALGIRSCDYAYENSDILIISGEVSWNNISEISAVLKKLHKKCIIIAYGSHACQKVSSADIYLPGCPPSKKSLSDAIRQAKKRLRQ